MRTSSRTAQRRAVGLTRGGSTSGLAGSSRFGKAPACGDDLAGDSDLQLPESWPELRVSPVPLITAGVSDVDLNGQVRTACRVAVRGVGIALRRRDPPHVVVLGEAALVGAILGAVAVLGLTTPARHAEIGWPLSFRFD